MAWTQVEKIPNGRIEIINDDVNINTYRVIYDPAATPPLIVYCNWATSVGETWSDVEALLDAHIEL